MYVREKHILSPFMINFEVSNFNFGQEGTLEAKKPKIRGQKLEAERENQGRISSFLILNFLTCYSLGKSYSFLECTYLARGKKKRTTFDW